MRRTVADSGRINIGPNVRGDKLQGKVTITANVSGILLSPYQLGDERKPERKVVEWDHFMRIKIPVQFLQRVGIAVGDKVDLIFRKDGAILLVPAVDTCALCGKPSNHMVEMPNGRLVCEKCRKYLSGR